MKSGVALLVVLAVAAVATSAFVASDPMTTNVPKKTRILFLCTGNSCRSQMAEGWARTLKSDSLEPYSAGIEKHGLNPRAVAVMREAGVDISAQQSKTVDELPPIDFDVVITVCDHAAARCPTFPAAPRVDHVPFDDPPKLAADAASEEEALGHYRRVRDEVRDFVAGLPDSLPR
jgi:arsenate reductase